MLPLRPRLVLIFALLAFTLNAFTPSASLCAQAPTMGSAYSAGQPMGATAQKLPSYLAGAGVEQRLGQPLPLAAVFTDETGRTAPLSAFFSGRPVVLALVYYRCIMLCPQILHGLALGLAQTTLIPGKDYDVIVASIDPGDKAIDAIAEKQQFLATMNAPTSAAPFLHFLTGQPPSIAALSAATGFHYVAVPGPDGKMDQFAHSSVIMFATADGKLSKYLSGIDYPARDLRLALLDASARRISNPVDLIILYCCSYNPVIGKYSVSVLRILGLAGMVSVFVVIGMIVLLTRKPHIRTSASVAAQQNDLEL
jgi:protein SCO1/2